MFDFGFSELVVIGAVGLVVLGPKRLPVVARQIGQWIGKAQRMVQQVKNDIAHESELAELKDIQKQASDIEKNWGQIQSEFDDASKKVGKELTEASDQAKSAVSEASSSVTPVTSDVPEASSSADADVYKPDMEAVVQNSTPAYLDEPVCGDEYQPYDSSSGSKVFEKRYRPGPGLDDVVVQVERLKAEVGDRSPLLIGYNSRYAPRSRSNRVRIYR